MNTQTGDLDNSRIIIGIDWADAEHAFHLLTSDGNELPGKLEQKPEAIDNWIAMLQDRYPRAVFDIIVEQSKGALIAALLKYECVRIYPINPGQSASYRKAMNYGGSKNDPTDAVLLAYFLRHYREQLRPLQVDDPSTRMLAILVEDRRRAVDQRTKLTLELMAVLKRYFPLVLQLVQSKVYARFVCQLLLKWPTLAKLQKARPTTLRNFFYAQNLRGDHVEKKLELIAAAVPLTEDAPIVETHARRAGNLVRLLSVLNDAIASYDREIKRLLEAHADYPIFASFPGAAVQMRSRMVAAFGTQRDRYTSAEALQSFSGIAPVTSQSGRQRKVSHRWACPKFLKQTFHEYAGLSINASSWAKAYYRMQLHRGKKPQIAKRALAFKWMRIMYRCWIDRTVYDEEKYLAQLRKRNAPLLQFIET